MNKLILITILLLTGCTTLKESKIVPHTEYFVKTADLYRRVDGIPQPSVKFVGNGTDLLREVNNYANKRITYTNEVKGADYWQSPLETEEQRRGDCEDFAIYKMQLLIANGIPEKDLSIVVGNNFSGIAHAVLRVKLNNGVYYLDNQTGAIYGNPIVSPVYTINRFGYSKFTK